MDGGTNPGALSRRDLLRRASGLWLAAGAPFGGLVPVAAQELALPRSPLRKGVSMGGYGPLTVPDGHPNDYRLHGNREYLRDVSGTRWVKLWVSWAHLQEELSPASRAESWAHLNQAPGGERALARLDRQIRAANEDAAARPGGMGVIVTLYQDFPTWSSAPVAEDPARADKPLNARLPVDLSPAGPWAWWVGHLCARYRRGVPPSPTGPVDAPTGPTFGNPLGAWIDLLEIVNEPNFLLWPQAGLHLRVAEMIATASAVAAELGGPGLLAPATSDSPDHPYERPRATDWLTFTTRLLEALAGFEPPGWLAWSAHNYLDVKDEVSREASRARRTLEMLRLHHFPRRALGPGARRLWLTEGGFDLHPEQGSDEARLAQADKIERNFLAMSEEPGVHLWTQHGINDVTTNDFKSGLRDDFLTPGGRGTARPSWHAFGALPGAPGP
jgi:hypothetical protein